MTEDKGFLSVAMGAGVAASHTISLKTSPQPAASSVTPGCASNALRWTRGASSPFFGPCAPVVKGHVHRDGSVA